MEKMLKNQIQDSLTTTMNDLKTSLQVLSGQLIEFSGDAYLPQLPRFDKDAEKSVPEYIEVTPSPSSQISRETAIICSFNKITALPKENTALAMRFPGYICVPTQHQNAVLQSINEVNAIKNQLKTLVRTSFRNRQTAHEVLHHLFPGLLYQQAIRQIHLLSSETLCSINFYWCSRPMVRRLTREKALEEIDAAKEFRRFDLREFSKDEVLQRIEFEKNIINSVPKNKFIIERRIARVQPYYEVYASQNNGKRGKKLTGRNASLPIIIFCDAVNLISPLKSYSLASANVDNAPDSIVEEVLLARKKWYLTSIPARF